MRKALAELTKRPAASTQTTRGRSLRSLTRTSDHSESLLGTKLGWRHDEAARAARGHLRHRPRRRRPGRPVEPARPARRRRWPDALRPARRRDGYLAEGPD